MEYELRIEKRRHKRLKTIILADIYAINGNRLLGRGCITDISAGGVQIETREPVTVDEEFILKFYLPNGTSFDKIKGVIVRRNKESFTYLYGIKFTEISFSDRVKIWWYVRFH